MVSTPESPIPVPNFGDPQLPIARVAQLHQRLPCVQLERTTVRGSEDSQQDLQYQKAYADLLLHLLGEGWVRVSVIPWTCHVGKQADFCWRINRHGNRTQHTGSLVGDVGRTRRRMGVLARLSWSVEFLSTWLALLAAEAEPTSGLCGRVAASRLHAQILVTCIYAALTAWATYTVDSYKNEYYLSSSRPKYESPCL